MTGTGPTSPGSTGAERPARVRRARGAEAPGGGVEDGEEAGFEEQAVPLEAEEVLAGGGEGEVGEPEPDERDAQLIPTISYKLRKYGPFAIKDHIGLVRFVAESPSSG